MKHKGQSSGLISGVHWPGEVIIGLQKIELVLCCKVRRCPPGQSSCASCNTRDASTDLRQQDNPSSSHNLGWICLRDFMIQCKMVLPEQHTLALRVRVGHDLKTEHTACPDRMVSKRQTLSRWKHGMSRCEPVGSVFDTAVQRSHAFCV